MVACCFTMDRFSDSWALVSLQRADGWRLDAWYRRVKWSKASKWSILFFWLVLGVASGKRIPTLDCKRHLWDMGITKDLRPSSLLDEAREANAEFMQVRREEKKKEKKRRLKERIDCFWPRGDDLQLSLYVVFSIKVIATIIQSSESNGKIKSRQKAIIDTTGGKDVRSTLSISSPSLGMMRRTKNARLKWRWTRSLMAYEGILNGIPVCDLTERVFPRKLGSLWM